MTLRELIFLFMHWKTCLFRGNPYLVLGILVCLTIVGAIVGVPMIIGGLKLREISTLSDDEILKKKDTILIWSIVFLILCTVSGVLGLLYYIGLENPNLFGSLGNNNDKYDELEKLNNLYKEKILTKEEFEKEKERILNNK